MDACPGEIIGEGAGMQGIDVGVGMADEVVHGGRMKEELDVGDCVGVDATSGAGRRGADSVWEGLRGCGCLGICRCVLGRCMCRVSSCALLLQRRSV